MDRSTGLQIVEILRDISEALDQIAENTTPAEAGSEAGSGSGTAET